MTNPSRTEALLATLVVPVLDPHAGSSLRQADPTPALSARLDTAFAMARELHATQTRKATGIPYLTHLMAVAALVGEHGGSEVEMIAALLHDAVEDCGGAPVLARSQATRLIQRGTLFRRGGVESSPEKPSVPGNRIKDVRCRLEPLWAKGNSSSKRCWRYHRKAGSWPQAIHRS